MKRQFSYTVCLASYNGATYIKSQIESIERQFSEKDELIVSDDGSSDNTLEVVSELNDEYHNITIVNGPHMGFSCNFGNAAKYAKYNDALYLGRDTGFPIALEGALKLKEISYLKICIFRTSRSLIRLAGRDQHNNRERE